MAVRQSAINLVKSKGFSNVGTMARVADELDMPFAAVVALFDMESKGKNIYGSDRGGTFADRGAVTEENFKQFYSLVVERGRPPNGVGPSQITYAGRARRDSSRDGGFFRLMKEQDLKPWDVYDNMFFGVSLLKEYYEKTGSWYQAFKKYNGKDSYAVVAVARKRKWRKAILADAKKNRA